MEDNRGDPSAGEVSRGRIYAALVETIAFARIARDVPELTFSDGAGI